MTLGERGLPRRVPWAAALLALLSSGASCAVPALVDHTHEFAGVLPGGDGGFPRPEMNVRVRGQGTYGPLVSAAVPVDPEGRYRVTIDERYCEPAWIVPPLDWIHRFTWVLPFWWVPVVGPVLAGPRAHPLGDLALEVIGPGNSRREEKATFEIVRDGRFRILYRPRSAGEP